MGFSCYSRVNLEFPQIEVRFQHLSVDAYVHVGSRALPTIPNFIFNMGEVRIWYLNYFSTRKFSVYLYFLSF